MLRLALSVILLGGLLTTSSSSKVNCDAAYANFVELLVQRVATLSGDQLASMNRRGLRIYDACDTGHLDRPEAKFRDLEQQTQQSP